MDNKVIDLTKQINKRNKVQNTKSYEECISESYAEDLTNKFKNMLNEEIKINKNERRK